MKKIITGPATLAILISVAFVVELILPWNFAWLGIRPRSLMGLTGIPVSPFLHANLKHLIANLLPLFIMGCFVSALAPKLYALRTLFLIFVSGFFTWMISSSGVVIGASGLVFAYWSFLIANGFLNQKVRDVFIALVTILIYGALIFSLFQYQEGVSWAGHMSGFMAGVILAFFSHRKIQN